MLVVVATEYSAPLFLGTDLAASDPFVFNNLIKCSTLLRVDLQHPADDMPTFSREQAQQAPRTLDYLWRLSARGSRCAATVVMISTLMA
jgi:hypothetical protein